MGKRQELIHCRVLRRGGPDRTGSLLVHTLTEQAYRDRRLLRPHTDHEGASSDYKVRDETS